MNYSEALSFVFRDDNWVKKIALGGLIAFFSFFGGLFFIIGFLLVGYYVAVVRNVFHDVEDPLPDWSDVSKIFVDGLLGGVIIFAYTVVLGGLCALAIVSIANQTHTGDAELAMGCVTISLVTLFALMILINYALVQLAITDNFAAAFNFSQMFLVFRHQLGHYLAISVFSVILNSMLFLAALGIFAPFTNFWGMVVQAHLFGQCARQLQTTTHLVQST